MYLDANQSIDVDGNAKDVDEVRQLGGHLLVQCQGDSGSKTLNVLKFDAETCHTPNRQEHGHMIDLFCFASVLCRLQAMELSSYQALFRLTRQQSP
jgi:hypothetical protein